MKAMKNKKTSFQRIKEEGLTTYFFKKIVKHSLRSEFYKKINDIFFMKLRWWDKTQLNKILHEHANMFIVFFDFYPGWTGLMFQRPHHMALQFSKNNYLYFYYDPLVVGFEKINDNLYLTNRWDLLLELPDIIYQVYSADLPERCWKVLEEQKEKNV